MGSEQFIDSVGEFQQWKSIITKELKNFRLWLKRNQLSNDENEKRLKTMLEAMETEHLTIAFAGEFSRGKTELINSIFFAEYGQRILPSQAGRTTMCPTEILYDQASQSSYLRLLPIETRLQDVPLSAYREKTGHWVEIPFMSESPYEIAQSMLAITQTKTVSRADAMALGFNEGMLMENEENPEKVDIPAWRHAIASFAHPMLKQGLRIIDTPGLNALGSEPELTFNLLPQAQAVVFVLAADAGVTASDMSVWEDHIEQLKNRPNLGIYAVLNKIDVLWDELSGRKKTEKAITRVIRQTARHLKIPESDILTVSAQKALLGKVKEDKGLILRSQILEMEKVLSDTILGNKEKLLWDSVVEQSKHLILDNQQVLLARKEQLETQKQELKQLQDQKGVELGDLLERSKMAQAEFKKRQLTLKPSQRLLERQTDILLDSISNASINDIIQMTLKDLVESKTTVGMMRTTKRFFLAIENLMNEFCREAELSNKMADSMYRKFERDFGVQLLEARFLKAKHFRRELLNVLDDANQFNRNFLFSVTEQSIAVRRFFMTTVNNISAFFKIVRKDLRQWNVDVMSPLIQQVHSQKQLLDSNYTQLLALQRNDATIGGRLKALNALILEVETESKIAEDSILVLGEAAPKSAAHNVVELARARR